MGRKCISKPETKIVDEFIDNGCGFPVKLKNVKMVNTRGVWTPCIKYDDLHKRVARELLLNAAEGKKLSTKQIMFISFLIGKPVYEEFDIEIDF